MKRLKGQSSVEYTLLLGILFVILVSVLVFVYSYYKNFEKETGIIEGKMAVEKICSSVDYLAEFDDGSINHVNVFLPPGYDPSNSYVKTNLINVRIGNSDINCVTHVPVQGSLPDSSGKARIKIKRTKKGVTIG